jgi:hypothetical protein
MVKEIIWNHVIAKSADFTEIGFIFAKIPSSLFRLQSFTIAKNVAIIANIDHRQGVGRSDTNEGQTFKESHMYEKRPT